MYRHVMLIRVSARPFRQPRGVVFDLDGTLLDSSQDLTAAVNHALAELGVPKRSEREVERFLGDGARDLVHRALGEPDDEALVREGLRLFREHYAQHAADATHLYPGISALLREIAAIPKAIATNKPERFTRQILDSLDLARPFVAVIGGDTLKTRKPQPEMILEACRLMRLPAEECLVVGDGEQDLKSARAAGAASAAVTWGYKSRVYLERHEPDFVLEEPLDLLTLWRTGGAG